MEEFLTPLMSIILSSMIGFIKLESILFKIVKEHGDNELGDFKPIILSMLDTYTYEKEILKIANHLIENDTNSAIMELKKKRTKGYKPKSKECGICNTSILYSSIPIIIFFCGHSFHQSCINFNGEINQVCPFCNHTSLNKNNSSISTYQKVSFFFLSKKNMYII